TAANATSITVSKPAGTAQNDLLIAIVVHQGGMWEGIAAPPGWSVIPNTDAFIGTTGPHTHAFRKLAGASEPASYTFSDQGSAQDMAAGVLDVTGARTAPIDTSAIQTNGYGLTVHAPSITTTLDNELVVFAGAANGSVTFTPPSGMTENVDVASHGTYKLS